MMCLRWIHLVYDRHHFISEGSTSSQLLHALCIIHGLMTALGDPLRSSPLLWVPESLLRVFIQRVSNLRCV